MILNSSSGEMHVNGTPHTDHQAYSIPEVPLGSRRHIKVIYIGFGMSGIDFAYHAQSLPDLELQIYEKNVRAGFNNAVRSDQRTKLIGSPLSA